MPAWTAGKHAGEPFLGCKIVSVFPDNAAAGKPSLYGSYLLMSGASGEPLALFDARVLTAWRTAAASALAATYLARADAAHLVMIGAGALAPHVIRAHAAVRPIKRINVFSRTAEPREAFARALEKELGIETRGAASAQACVADADVVVTITKSAEPVCRADWLKQGAHVNAAGANSADRSEVDADTVLRAAVKATDQVEQAKVEAGEFRELVAAGKLAWSDICELGDLVTGKAKGRTSPSELTLFKSLGIALEDVAFGEVVYQRALAAGVGRPI